MRIMNYASSQILEYIRPQYKSEPKLHVILSMCEGPHVEKVHERYQ